MVLTHAGTNKHMEEEIAAIKTQLEALDQKILSLHSLHSPMNNQYQSGSSAGTGSSSSSNFHGTKLDFPHLTTYTMKRELDTVLVFLSPNFSSYFYPVSKMVDASITHFHF